MEKLQPQDITSLLQVYFIFIPCLESSITPVQQTFCMALGTKTNPVQLSAR